MDPELDFRRPEMVLRRVVFPAPLAPSRVTISRSWTFNETPFRAGKFA
jgi:hypothetical protein